MPQTKKAKPGTKAAGGSPGRAVPRLQVFYEGKGRTRQSSKDECDINNILAKYQKTGAIEHANKHAPSYGFATGDDFTSAMFLIAKASRMFEELPSTLRKKFQTPAEFLDFVQNPDNLDEMAELGLIEGPVPRHTVAEAPNQPVEAETDIQATADA